MDFLSENTFYIPRILFERTLSIIYFIGFLVALNQFPALLGERGLLPVTQFLKYINFKQAPSIFHAHYSDPFFKFICVIGMLLALSICLGVSSIIHPGIHMLIWFCLYFLYLSIQNVGQVFYGFGWESMLCEAGFLMIFMGPEWMEPSWVPVLMIRWMLFRTELGAGLIKLRGDESWKDLTALYYHHETQPMPNPLSRYFHSLPKSILRNGVRFSHFVQLVAPFGLFLPQPFSSLAGILIILHQFILIVGGNYSWLNWLTIILAFPAFSSQTYPISLSPRPSWFDFLLIGFGFWGIYLSYNPLLNLFSKNQKMNYCWNRFSLFGAYGAFGSMTKKRYELILEGQADEKSEWKAYEFKGKPGALDKRPSQWAPYHLRLDWLMWFLPFSVLAGEGRVYVLNQEGWFLIFLQKLLNNDPLTLKLLKFNPFPTKPPKKIRVQYYQYQFTNHEEFKKTGQYWKRTFIGEYLPALEADDFDREMQA